MFRRVRVKGDSMLPTFSDGQVLWSNRLVYRFRAPRKGEVVVVDHPTRPLRLIKRVQAVPGDVVDGKVLAADQFYVTGDNSSASTASESFGPVHRRLILARVKRASA